MPLTVRLKKAVCWSLPLLRKKVTRVSSATAEGRNRHIIDLADELVVGYAGKGGMLEKILAQEVWHSL